MNTWISVSAGDTSTAELLLGVELAQNLARRFFASSIEILGEFHYVENWHVLSGVELA